MCNDIGNKTYAVKTLKHNFGHEFLAGDIFEIEMNLFPILIFYWVVFPVSLLVQVENVKAFWIQEELCF
jgi:site-specific DNA-cytosine methylase